MRTHLSSTYHYQALDEYAHRSRNFGGRSETDSDWSTEDSRSKNDSLQTDDVTEDGVTGGGGAPHGGGGGGGAGEGEGEGEGEGGRTGTGTGTGTRLSAAPQSDI